MGHRAGSGGDVVARRYAISRPDRAQNGDLQQPQLLLPELPGLFRVLLVPVQTGPDQYLRRHFDTKREYPLETRLGIAWFPNPSFLLSADFGYWGKAKDKILDRTMEATWNAALGMEYYLSNRWALRGGLYTNRANTPSDVTIYDHIDYYGGSLSLTRFTRSSSITLGISEALGSGEAQVFNSNFQNQDVSSQVTTVFLSTQYVY